MVASVESLIVHSCPSIGQMHVNGEESFVMLSAGVACSCLGSRHEN